MAMMSQFLGFMLDAYDMALVLVMAPVLIKVFVSPKGSAAWQYIVIVFTYSITMASRPIGSALFGRYADKNRSAVSAGFDHWRRGYHVSSRRLSPHLRADRRLVVCHLLRSALCMGIFFGGEYAVGHTFAIEYAPQKRRGAIGGFIQSGFPLGYVFASLVFALISFLTTKEFMAAYGWRIAFMSGVIPVVLALYIRNNLHESPEFEKAKASGKMDESPFLSLFKPPQVWTFCKFSSL